MLAIAWAGVAAASSGGHGEEHAGPLLSDLFFPAVNFLLFVWLVRWAGGDAIRDYLYARRQRISADLEAAERAVRDAQRTYDDIKTRFGRAAQEAEGIRADVRAIAEVERERRRRLVSEAVARIKADTGIIAEQEVETARRMLRRETVQAAVAETLAVLRRQIKPSDQDRFAADFVGAMRAQGHP